VTEHIDDDTWERLMLRELPPAEREAALRHVTACPECTTIHRGLLALEHDARAEGLLDGVVDEPAPAAPVTRRRWWWAGAAALTAAAALVLWWQVDGGRGGRGPVRGGPGAAVEVSAQGRVLSWTPVAGADGYAISVFAEDGTPVWSTEAAAPPVTWRDAAPGRYRWEVEARAGDRTVATSRLAPLVIAP